MRELVERLRSGEGFRRDPTAAMFWADYAASRGIAEMRAVADAIAPTLTALDHADLREMSIERPPYPELAPPIAPPAKPPELERSRVPALGVRLAYLIQTGIRAARDLERMRSELRRYVIGEEWVYLRRNRDHVRDQGWDAEFLAALEDAIRWFEPMRYDAAKAYDTSLELEKTDPGLSAMLLVHAIGMHEPRARKDPRGGAEDGEWRVSLETTLNRLTTLAEGDNAWAMLELARFHYDGIETERDIAKACSLVNRALELSPRLREERCLPVGTLRNRDCRRAVDPDSAGYCGYDGLD
ncbi:MAG: hypothetical protein HQL41_12800 [Alphaproteobacteria bacterium]|nr:hypothetical protein [Alphaproteobacteria bacterium]